MELVMCVYSMIMDHYHDKWIQHEPLKVFPIIYPNPMISPEEIKELKELLKKAKEYDKKNSQPDCEIEEKKKKLKELAETLGIEIEFP